MLLDYPVHLHWSERAAAYIAEAIGYPGGLFAQGATEAVAMAELAAAMQAAENAKNQQPAPKGKKP